MEIWSPQVLEPNKLFQIDFDCESGFNLVEMIRLFPATSDAISSLSSISSALISSLEFTVTSSLTLLSLRKTISTSWYFVLKVTFAFALTLHSLAIFFVFNNSFENPNWIVKRNKLYISICLIFCVIFFVYRFFNFVDQL